ncbi:patatin-like phospholipase family protein [Psychrosphaera sp. B3R10]|nr:MULTISPECIES: cyclic nucleotide-binding and patatin-like phospholipase domain-containing protein [unclassified Psychrosphaera]MBU2880446.1 patatin-like phospholipase family protein [Psychrosphaera sp. I2R16]MBU2991453.1 patatin-like phospholipase family protein [Psychrosphaera sp. B3R10]
MNVSTEYLIELLKASSDFNQLSEGAMIGLAEALEVITVAGGAEVIREGAESDSMFILVSGRLRVSRTDKNGQRLLYNEVLPGDCVGETGMILRQARTADITSMRESQLAVLSDKAYEELIAKHPSELNRAFSQAIYRHLRHDRRVAERRRAQSFFLIPIHETVDMSVFTSQMKLNLTKYGSTEVVPVSLIDAERTVGDDGYLNLDKLEADFDYIIYQGELNLDEQLNETFEHADQVIFVADGTKSSSLTKLEESLRSRFDIALIRSHLALVYPESEVSCGDRAEWNKERKTERVYPIKLASSDDFGRLVRFLLGKAIGVVLGGGGARGFAHLGVLRAFEESNIPIDLIGGNSMGALIGACYVSGMPRESIHKEILRYSKGGMKLTFPLVALMSNKNLKGAFQEALGNLDIQRIWTPYFAAACNLTTAETLVLEEGPLWQAVLASNSPAGLFPPVVVDGQLLVDGAILENVPVQAMRQRLSTPLERRRGNGAVIAIDVDVKDAFEVNKNVTDLSSWNKLKSHFEKAHDNLPGIVDILMQVAHIGGLAQRQQTKHAADIYFEPPLSNFSIMDYKKAEEIIEVGYEYAMQQINVIKSSIQ